MEGSETPELPHWLKLCEHESYHDGVAEEWLSPEAVRVIYDEGRKWCEEKSMAGGRLGKLTRG